MHARMRARFLHRRRHEAGQAGLLLTCSPLPIMRLRAFPPPPPTPMTLTLASPPTGAKPGYPALWTTRLARVERLLLPLGVRMLELTLRMAETPRAACCAGDTRREVDAVGTRGTAGAAARLLHAEEEREVCMVACQVEGRAASCFWWDPAELLLGPQPLEELVWTNILKTKTKIQKNQV
jgi:hypothetical protein